MKQPVPGRSVLAWRHDDTLAAAYGSGLLMAVCIVLVAVLLPHMPVGCIVGLGVLFFLCMVLSDALCVTAAMSANQSARFGMLGLSVLCACGVGVSLARLMVASDPILLELCMAAGCVTVNSSVLMGWLKDARVLGAVSVLWALSIMVFLIAALTFVAGLHIVVVAAGMVALGVYGAQLMPNLVVHVPDRYLVQWRGYMTQRWTVRGTIPENARTLSLADIEHDMPRFLASYACGVVGCGLCALFGYTMLIWRADYASALVRAGIVALSVALVTFFVLKPRQSGRTFERMMMRFLGVAVLLMALMRLDVMIPVMHGGNMFWAILACVVMGIAMTVAMLAQHSGFYSLLMSRIGDGLCSMAIVIVLPAAFLAAGGFELLRGGM